MKHLNLKVTSEFEQDLRRFMKKSGITQKSDAIRQAVQEAVARTHGTSDFDYRSWLGPGLKGPLNPEPRFQSDEDLWS